MAAVASKPSSSPPSRVAHDTVATAVESLLRWIGDQSKHKKSQLLDHDELIHVVLSMKKIPSESRLKPYLIPIPHSLHTDDFTSICLFVDDRPKSSVTPSTVLEKIKSESIPISDVIGLSQLKSDYVAYEARRKLCGSYDLFFADRRILPLLPRLIGKQFFKKKKQPLTINLLRKNWKEDLRRRCGSTLLHLRTGTCCQINAARLSMGRDAIVENVLAVVEGAIKLIPNMWKNVRSIHVKSEESVGLPIYQSLPDVGLKIEVGRKTVEEVGDANDDGVGSEEVVQSVEGKVSDGKVKNFRSKKRKKVHKIRYMDNDLDNVDLKTDEASVGGEKLENEEGEERNKIKKNRQKGERLENEEGEERNKIKKNRQKGEKLENEEGEERIKKNKKKDVKDKTSNKGKKLKKAEGTSSNEDGGGLKDGIQVANNIEVRKRKSRGKT